MTALRTVEWMKREGYYKRWLIPQLGCNKGTLYKNRPVGNSPEFMPLDMLLNNDIQVSLSIHYAITSHLPDEEPHKLSMGTPNTIVSGIERIWGIGGNASSWKRIMQDCDKALVAFGKVFRAGEKMVPGLANRSGHQNHAAGRNQAGWGGVRVKNLLLEEVGRWLHPQEEEAKAERTKELIKSLTAQAQVVEVLSDEEDGSGVDN